MATCENELPYSVPENQETDEVKLWFKSKCSVGVCMSVRVKVIQS